MIKNHASSIVNNMYKVFCGHCHRETRFAHVSRGQVSGEPQGWLRITERVHPDIDKTGNLLIGWFCSWSCLWYRAGELRNDEQE